MLHVCGGMGYEMWWWQADWTKSGHVLEEWLAVMLVMCAVLLCDVCG